MYKSDSTLPKSWFTKSGSIKSSIPATDKEKIYVARFREVHGDRYEYTNFVFNGAAEKSEIICKVHGAFEQAPKHHQKGVGCMACGGRAQKTTDEFIQQAMRVHGETYRYDEYVYVRDRDKVHITCKTHGLFTQIPSDHLQGKGCPKCNGMNQNVLYFWKFLGSPLYKVGVTTASWGHRRIKEVSKAHGTTPEVLGYIKVQDPKALEAIVLDTYSSKVATKVAAEAGYTEILELTEEDEADILSFIWSCTRI